MLLLRSVAWLCLLAASFLLVASAAAGEQAQLAVGDVCPKLSFKDVWYLPRTLDDLGEHRATVLAAVAVDCPVTNAALPELVRLAQKYTPQGVQFVALNVDGDDSIREMAAQRLAAEAPFPFVKDIDGHCAAALAIDVTPTFVVLDAARRIVYRGRLDDGQTADGARREPSRRDLEAALDHVLTDQAVSVAQTVPLGSPVRSAEAIAADPAITFASQIASIMQKHCQDCHRPGTEAPFALISYDDVAAVGEMVAEVVADERMPPWYASSGEFENHRGLSRDQRRLVQQWVKAGMPTGDLAALPPSRPLPTNEGGWVINEPDRVIKAPKHKLPADGFVPYKYVILPYVFPHDTWVQECEILPDNPRVVHHCNMAYIQLGKKDWDAAHFVMGKVPGVQPMQLHDNVGFCFPKGSMLVLQIHYTTTGEPEECQISVGMRYAREKIQKELRFLWMVDTKFAIPPGDPAHRVAASQTLERDVLGVGLFAHMHVRGKDMSFTARYPDGRDETLLVIPNYSFDWQMAYSYGATAKRLPKGTTIDCVAHYDNSKFNPYNPDPTATVREGQQTVEEMLNGVFIYLEADEELNLDIDPQTGKPLAKETAEAATDG